MEAYNEKIHFENPFLSLRIFRVDRQNNFIGRWHYHKELEILIVHEGVLDVFVEDECYSMQAGDVLLIGDSQLHRDRSYDDVFLDYTVLQFDLNQYFDEAIKPYMKYFSDTQRPLSHLNYIFLENQSVKADVFHCVMQILEESQTKKVGYEIAVSMQIKQIILNLLRNDSDKVLNYRDQFELQRLKPALDYIQTHITEKITLEEVSRSCNMSYYYFTKFFKKTLGISFMDYVNTNKIKKAERLLLTKDLSIAQIAEQVGMSNMTHFYAMFKKYTSFAPNEFRKKMSAWKSSVDKFPGE
jgi:YesN/AraC family two-component response regulator